MKKLNEQLLEIESYIPHYREESAIISAANIGWHISHALITFNNICIATLASQPLNYQPKRSFYKTVIMFTGKIPRGKARAPKTVVPLYPIDEMSLREQISEAKTLSQKLAATTKDKHFSHPMFGHLNKVATIKFIGIHTAHHLAIVRDILKNQTTVSPN